MPQTKIAKLAKEIQKDVPKKETPPALLKDDPVQHVLEELAKVLKAQPDELLSDLLLLMSDTLINAIENTLPKNRPLKSLRMDIANTMGTLLVFAEKANLITINKR